MTQHSLSLPTLALATSHPARHASRRGNLLAGRPAARPDLQRPVLVLGPDDRGLLPAVLCGPPAAAPERGVPRLARCGRGGGFPRLQALQAARLAGRSRPQQAGGAGLRAVRFDRRRHAALARRGGAPGRPVERRAQQALHRRAGRQSARLAGGAQAPALPQGAARGRVGGRRALWRGLRLAEPRLRDQRQGARHDARHLCQGRRRRPYRLHHGRFRLWPRAGGGDAEGHRRGIPGRQRPHARKGPEARLPGRRHHAQRPRARRRA